MRKLIFGLLIALMAQGFPSLASAQTVYYNWRYANHATDCTALTTGKLHDMCEESSTHDLYVCVPTAGDCDTPAEWKRANNTAIVEVPFIEWATSWTVANGKAYFYVPSRLNNFVLTGVHLQTVTVGTTNTSAIQLTKCSTVATGNVCSGTTASMLSTVLSIDSNEDDSSTAATAAVINGSNSTVTTGQVIRIDVTAISTTAPKGGVVTLTFYKS